MGPEVDPFTGDEVVPQRTGVVVIGGGIIGTSAALALAEQGIDVTLCEKGHVAGEQSSRNWGWVRKNARDEREIPLIMESLRQWEGMNARVEGETGFRTCGVLSIAKTDADREGQAEWLERARPYQIGSRFVEGAELEALMPGAARKFKAAMYNATDGRAEPQKAAPAIARAVQRNGGKVLTNCAVRGLDMQGGRVAGVVTEKGRIACDGVILATGSWSRLFCGSIGLRLPQLKVLSSVLRTAPMEGLPETSAWVGNFAYRKRLDGGYNIANGRGSVVPIVPDMLAFGMEFLPALRSKWGALHPRLNERFLIEARQPKHWDLDRGSPFEKIRVLDPKPDIRRNERAAQDVRELYPAAAANLRIVQHWAGLIDVTPDAVPVISTVDKVPGLVIATGFSGHGFGIGPGAGRLAADLVTGAPPVVDPTAFRFSRFSDGSKITIDAGF